MKILLCNTLEKRGGAAKATQRILHSLRQRSVDINLLVAYKESEDERVLTSESFLFRIFKRLVPIIDALPKLLFIKDRKKPFSSSLMSFGFRKIVKRYNPDILHLNYINMGLFSIKDIGSFKMPIVWTLHDSWAFTGGCHLPNGCYKYNDECGLCPVLSSKGERDLSRYVLSKKLKHWEANNITLVCPSQWMVNNVKKSVLFKDSNIEVIPNPIDTDIYKPKDKKESRKELGLDINRKYILFGAVDALNDKNKGFEYLKESLNNLNMKNVELLVFGSKDEDLDIDIPVKNMGYVNDENRLVSIYSASDVTVIPSISENLPNVMIESLSCGTPVIGFRVGGIPDIIEDDRLGLMADPYDTNDLTKKIRMVLNNSSNDSSYRYNYIKNKYSYNLISEKYLKLYEELLS